MENMQTKGGPNNPGDKSQYPCQIRLCAGTNFLLISSICVHSYRTSISILEPDDPITPLRLNAQQTVTFSRLSRQY